VASPQPPPLAHALQRALCCRHAVVCLLRLLPCVLYLLPLPVQVSQDGCARGLPGKGSVGAEPGGSIRSACAACPCTWLPGEWDLGLSWICCVLQLLLAA